MLSWSDAVTGPVSVASHTEYDGLDRKQFVYDAYQTDLERKTEYQYDAQSNLLSEVGPEGRTVSYRYDERNRVKKLITPATVDGLATDTLQKYDGLGNVVWLQNRRDQVTQTVYDELYRPILVTDAKQQSISTSYGEVGQVKTQTDKRGIIRETYYDQLYRVTEQYVNDNQGKRFLLLANDYDLELDPQNRNGLRKNKTTDANGNDVICVLDFRGNAIRTTLPGDGQAGYAAADMVNHYDRTGLLERSIDAAANETAYTYYADGSVKTVTNAEQEATAYDYDVFGNQALVTKPKGTRQRLSYDERGRLASVEDHLGNLSRFEYDVNSNLRHQYTPAANDSGENHVEYVYDTLNRKRQHIQYKSQGNLVTLYSYDAEGNLTGLIDAKGQAFAYGYDELNRETSRSYPAGGDLVSIGTSYDANNNVERITETKAGGVIEITDHNYDLLNRLEVRNQRGHIVSYAYDFNGNRTGVTAPGGNTRYTFDSRNRLHTAVANTHTTTYTYLQNGWLDTVAQGNGTGVDYDYDTVGRVTNILNTAAGGAELSRFEYDYDDNGNRIQQIETQNGFAADKVVTTGYIYDDLDRLESYTHNTSGTTPSVESHSYTFYPSYDRKTETVVKDGVTLQDRSYTYDETHWVSTIVEAAPGKAGTITYLYDANGNTQAKTNTTGDGPASTLFNYNQRNQLKSVATGAAGSEAGQGQYDYNYAGMRIRHLGSERGDIEYIYDDKSIIDEVVNGTNTEVAHYRYGDRLLSLETGGAEQFYHYASLGTTANLTDASGQNQVAYRVDPYGEITKQEGESVNRQVFTGHEHDTETGLIYMKARFYDPDIGRFLTQDTYLGENGTPPSLHRYLYAYGNPTINIDPDGHAVCQVNGAFTDKCGADDKVLITDSGRSTKHDVETPALTEEDKAAIEEDRRSSAAEGVAHWRRHCEYYNCNYENDGPPLTKEDKNLSDGEFANGTLGQQQLRVAHEKGKQMAAYGEAALTVAAPPSSAEELGYYVATGGAGYVVYKVGSKFYKVLKPRKGKPGDGSDIPYDSRNVRDHYVAKDGADNVSSTTVPPLNAKNVKLAGQRHPVTGIVFDNKGFPIFDDIAAYDTRLNIDGFRSASYTRQMQMASEDLAQAIRKGQVSPGKFSEEQLNQINRGSSKIDGYTWHHHQDTGRMQLVPEFEHGKTGHLGWESMHKGQ